MHLTYFGPNPVLAGRRYTAAVSESFVPGLRYRSTAQQLWALVVESYRGWEERINEAAAAADLSPASAWTLIQLDPNHPISQKELAALLHCNPSTVVDPTDRLEKGGLVLRQTNPSDRRANVLVVPDLEAGNMLAKSLSFLAGADAAGIVLGARVPIILTSRADSLTTRLASCAIGALVANARRVDVAKAVA